MPTRLSPGGISKVRTGPPAVGGALHSSGVESCKDRSTPEEAPDP